MSNCEHIQTGLTWIPGTAETFSRHCLDCNETLSLGPSNDGPMEVQIEIRAARLVGEHGFANCVEGFGWMDNWNAEAITGSNNPDWLAGWLARELFTHDDRDTRDASTWPWDPTQPVTGQYERRQIEDRDPVLAVIRNPTDENFNRFHETVLENLGVKRVQAVDFSKAVVAGGFSIDTGRGPYRIAKVDYEALERRTLVDGQPVTGDWPQPTAERTVGARIMSELFNSEFDAAIMADVAKRRALDEHGYAKPGVIVKESDLLGLADFVPDTDTGGES